MDERRFVVQFLHPGGEHAPDTQVGKRWNRGAHARKFLVAEGNCARGDESHDGQVAFWGEWEPTSRLVSDLAAANVAEPWQRFPRYLMAPTLEQPDSFNELRNTDPCVLGGFWYTGCQQRATNAVRWLAPGSVVLFGSRAGPRPSPAFVLDTVFVVASYVDHNASSFRTLLRGKVPDAYFVSTLEPWYWGTQSDPSDPGYRLYFGATREAPLNGMFSFFPAEPWTSQVRGFPRPRITDETVSNGKSQGYKLTEVSMDGAAAAWARVCDQVLAADLWLGTSAKMPA
jgi:hypothetical protein